MEKSLIIHPRTKPSVMLRREMVNKPEIIGKLGPVERAVFIASTAKTVGEYTSEDLAAELGTALKWISKDIGYRATDEGESKYIIVRTIEILKRYYSNFTLKDFRMAFEMSITGELDDYLPKNGNGQPDRGHYQQFNAEYICKILNAYKLRRNGILQKAYEILPEPEPERNAEQEERLRNRTKQDCVKVYQFFRINGHLPEISPIAEMLYYNLLAKVGLADAVEVTADEQRAILERMIAKFTGKGYTGEVKRLQADGIDAPELQFKAFTLARRKALIAAFERMDKMNIDLTDYITIKT